MFKWLGAKYCMIILKELVFLEDKKLISTRRITQGGEK